MFIHSYILSLLFSLRCPLRYHLRLLGQARTKVKITLSRPAGDWKEQMRKDTVGCMLGFYLVPGPSPQPVAFLRALRAQAPWGTRPSRHPRAAAASSLPSASSAVSSVRRAARDPSARAATTLGRGWTLAAAQAGERACKRGWRTWGGAGGLVGPRSASAATGRA